MGFIRRSYDTRIIGWLFGFTRPYRVLLAISLVFMLTTSVLELLVPYITKVAVDNYIFPSWGKVEFDAGENRFKKLFKRRYLQDSIPLGGESYLVNLSKVRKEDRIEFEKFGIVSRERYIVIDTSGLEENRLAGIYGIVKKHPGVFQVRGNYIIAGHSSVAGIDHYELGVLRGGEIQKLNRLVFFLVIILFLVFLLSSLYTYILNYTGQKIMHGMRLAVFSHVLSLPQSFFDKNPVGRLTTRITNDVNAINEMYTSVLVQFFKDVILICGVLFVMFRMNRELTFLIMLLTVLLGIVAALFRVRLKRVYREVRRSIAKLNSFVQESIGGIAVIKLYQRERENLERFKVVNSENLRANMEQLFTFATFRPIIEFISILAVALILWYGGLRILNLDLTLGALIAYLAYIRMLFSPIVELAEKYNIFQSAAAASENLYELTREKPERRAEGRRLDKVRGRIEFKNVWFSYDGDEWILRDVSFTVEPGQTLALVGLTGSGKTTIVNLILKFYEAQRGEILFDGVNIKELDPDFIRSHVSTVFQDLFLFEAKDRDDFSDKEPVFEMLSKNNGSFLSSGERQLLYIRNALLKNSRVLILDEATSSMDTWTESKINELLKRNAGKRTTILIAHRLSNVIQADKIVVIHRGKIHEVGTHKELLMKRGIYYNLYRLQSGIYSFSH